MNCVEGFDVVVSIVEFELTWIVQSQFLCVYKAATYVRGDAPFIAPRSGGLKQVFLLTEIFKVLSKFLGGADLSRRQRERVFQPFERLSVSFILASIAEFDGDVVF